MAPWDPKFQAVHCMLAAAGALQIFNSLCIVNEPVTKHISLAVRLFHRCETHWRPVAFDVTRGFLDSTSVYLRWPRTEAAEGNIIFAEFIENKLVAVRQVNLTSKERECKQC